MRKKRNIKPKKKWVTDEPCFACGLLMENGNIIHHEYTRKARPELQDEKWNHIPICFLHHTELHSMPTRKFVDKYTRAFAWMMNNGWELDDSCGKIKWIHRGSFIH